MLRECDTTFLQRVGTFDFQLLIMKLSMAVIATACAAGEAIASSATGGVACSSLNGPFCADLGSRFAVAPLHARQNLDLDEEVSETVERYVALQHLP